MRILSEHESPVTAVHFSPDGRWLISSEEHGRVLLRGAVDLAVEREMWPGWPDATLPKRAKLNRPVSDVLVTQNGRFLLIAFRPIGRTDGKWAIHRWEFAKPGTVRELAKGLGTRPALTQSPDGTEVVAFHDSGAHYYSTTRERLRWKLPRWSCAKRSDWGEVMGPACVAALNDLSACGGQNSGEVVLFRPNREYGLSFRCHPTSLRGVALPPEADRVITAGPSQIRMWTFADIDREATDWGYIWGSVAPSREWSRSGAQYITSMTLSPDGRTLAVGRNNGTVNFLDAESFEERVSFRWAIGNVTCLAFDADGLRAAAGGEKGSIVVWDLE